MGGAASEVSATTTRIALESAWFLPGSVRATSRKIGLKTEAAARFERGADIASAVVAIERAIGLLSKIGAGSKPSAIADLYPRRPPARKVALRRDRLARVLGLAVADTDVLRILTALGFIASDAAGGWSVEVPTFRVDVTREVDLVEEIGRHIGLDRVPATFPPLKDVPRQSAASAGRSRHLRRLLTGAGVQEAVTFTFIEQAAAAGYARPEELVGLANPLSEKFATLRPSLAPGLLESLAYNRNRQATDIRLFEIGSIFSKSAGERPAVGWVLTGRRDAHWSGSAGAIGFPDARGLGELIADGLGVPVEFEVASECPWLVRGQAATVRIGSEIAGWIGRLRAADAADDPVFAGELYLDVCDRMRRDARPVVGRLPRFPTIVRDLSIVIDERLPAAEVRGTIRSNAPATLVRVREFDRYQGKGVPDGQVSLSIRLTFQHPERTLTDADVQPVVDAIVAALEREHQAVLRGR
jgi:phenylalanyl-tRNA synthetase beta chain